MAEAKQIDLTKIMAAIQTIQDYVSAIDLAPKRFYLDKVPSKKHGFIYYVRYLDNGIVIPSHWTTGTNDKPKAESYAVYNRDRLLLAYYNRNIIKKPYGDMYSILKKYYAENSEYLKIDTNRGKLINEETRRSYYNYIIKQFIPYLKKHGIKSFEDIDPAFLARYQNYLLADKETKNGIIKGLKPQTIKIYLLTVSNIYNHLLIEGYIKTNPFKTMVKLKIKDELVRGCYEINDLKGVFNKTWKNNFHYLLCLMINTTGMRNSEIERLRVRDLIIIDKTNFISIKESKTKNGIRLVPLHDFVYKKIMFHVKQKDKKDEDLIFKNEGTVKIMSKTYEMANIELAFYTKYTSERLENENITFYSGRHFWKTLMDSEKLGDIEEYFMGHKTSGDVAKRYNHKDKQGKKKLVEKAKRVFAILDKYVFR